MSDEINDEIDADAEVIDDDEGAEVEGHVMFAAKKGFSVLGPVTLHQPISPRRSPRARSDSGAGNPTSRC